jgi:hypothetical protein
VLGGVLVAAILWKGIHTVDTARRAKQDLEATTAAVKALQERPADPAAMAAVGAALQPTARSLRALQTELQPLGPLVGLTRPLPPQVHWLADVPDVLAVAVPLVDAAALVSEPLTAAVPGAGAEPRQQAHFLLALGGRSADLPILMRELETAEAALPRLQGRALGGPLQPLGPLIAEVAESLPQVRQALGVLSVVGLVVSTSEPRTYLLIGQNNDELRASGGFIGTLGEFTVARGGILHFEYGSSYEVDAAITPPAPPPPFARHLGAGGWYLRDANWWPDFPATAAQIEEAWLRAGRGPLDGVIGIDNAVVDALLRIIGPLEVPGFGRVTADNFQRLTIEHLYSPTALAAAGDFHRNTTAFFGPFSRALVERLRTVSPAEVIALGQALRKLLDEKHIQVASKDPRVIELAHAQGWAGAIPALADDSLYVVDTTVSYGKSYLFVHSEGALQVAVSPDGRAAHDLVLRYANVYPRGRPAWMPAALVGGEHFDATSGRMVQDPGFWGNWLRVYLPLEAREIVVDGLEELTPPQPEFGRMLVAGYLPTAPGQTREVRVRYVTSSGTPPADTYHLFLQKQAGVHCRPMTILTRWPSGQSASYEGCPTVDRWVELAKPPTRN